MGCDCRKSLNVKQFVSTGKDNGTGGGNPSSDVNEKTDKKTKLKILKEMWEEAKRAKLKKES